MLRILRSRRRMRRRVPCGYGPVQDCVCSKMFFIYVSSDCMTFMFSTQVTQNYRTLDSEGGEGEGGFPGALGRCRTRLCVQQITAGDKPERPAATPCQDCPNFFPVFLYKYKCLYLYLHLYLYFKKIMREGGVVGISFNTIPYYRQKVVEPHTKYLQNSMMRKEREGDISAVVGISWQAPPPTVLVQHSSLPGLLQLLYLLVHCN